MLQTHQIDIVGIEKISGCSIGRYVAFCDLEAHPRRVGVRGFRIIDGDNRQSCGSVLGRDRIAQIGCKGRNSTLTGKVVPDNRNPNRNRTAGRWLQAECLIYSEYQGPRLTPPGDVRLRIQG
jgi:hypothetical protein